jgi:hypothetical protein
MRRDTRFRVLLCTDVLLDLLSPERPQFSEACEVIELCNGGGDMGFMTVASLRDVYHIVRKLRGESLAREAVATLMDLLIIAPLSAEECDIALRSGEPRFEDGLVRACAELNDIDFILTRKKGVYLGSAVRSLDCANYLKFVRS